MYKHVLLALFAASAAPGQAFADTDVVNIERPNWSATFNAYRIECDSPMKPERRHKLIAHALTTNMDGSSKFEGLLESRADFNNWEEYDPYESAFMGEYVVSENGERFFIQNEQVAANLLERFRKGELNAKGIPVEQVEALIPSVIAQCSYGS